MKCLVLANPLSHGGYAAKLFPKIRQLLPEADCVPFNDIDEANRLARVAEGYDTIVACGGDGTINAVADGVLNNRDGDLKFGVLYAGTSPDFCRFHGIPTQWQEAVRIIRDGRVVKIPVLQANGHCFFCSCNLGMGADVAELANRLRPVVGDFCGTLLALLFNLLDNRQYDFMVNGETIAGCNHLLVSRMPYIASGLKVPVPELSDDEYALWFVCKLSFWGWLKMLPRLYRGGTCGETRICRGAMRIMADRPGKLEYDGDPHGMLPVDIAFAPRRLKLIVGKENVVVKAQGDR